MAWMRAEATESAGLQGGKSAFRMDVNAGGCYKKAMLPGGSSLVKVVLRHRKLLNAT